MSETKELSWNEPAVITHLAFSSVLVCFFKSIQATIIPFSVINIMLFSIISFPLFWEELDKTQEFITRINQLPLTKEEKLKIVNYKPENIVEISVVSNALII